MYHAIHSLYVRIQEVKILESRWEDRRGRVAQYVEPVADRQSQECGIVTQIEGIDEGFGT